MTSARDLGPRTLVDATVALRPEHTDRPGSTQQSRGDRRLGPGTHVVGIFDPFGGTRLSSDDS
ncbi:hypothetical protein O3Q52_09470 [Streptomyces sp. ActVer]|uniref:hypothetical protein n=1 Tax=Streptomyces sp. ActVer TaxID=3014558 RepID=UPI0022B52D0D|nr:hypothetical protein [Streptomyces sp. ActVer]MCZ4508428.1 hypothetical protein [Streptomyces sp. ActVer]